ncbi:MAG TPA: CPBP family intramembrane metalloprotease [Deltaproteobacteria bacterium]|nr:CPBP family intramembrane metalloprotease [Deltaproteobacteria bacterium]HPR52506.1 CPBP family intramembrane metalloprotease [Deltaproteobacteria bacterium]
MKEEKTKRMKTSLLLFFLLSYGQVWLLYGLYEGLGITFSMDPGQAGGVLYLAGAAAPMIAAILVTAIAKGRQGITGLFRRSFHWRFSPVWYLAAVAIPLAVTALSTLAAIGFNDARVPQRWFSPVFGWGFLGFFLIYDGLGEEIGWRGFALPRLQTLLGPVGASVALGCIWALWHLPLFFMEGSFQYGDSILVYIYLLTCWSVVMTLLVNKARGSVLVAILFHETANFIAFTMHCPQMHYYLVIWGLAAAVSVVFLPGSKQTARMVDPY